MQEGIMIQNQQLPDKIEDLAKFVLVGREKLTSVRAEIRAISKLELAEEVREQKKEEAQMLGEALMDAEVRIGDLLKKIPKSSGKRTDLTSSQQCEKVDSKNGNAVVFEKQEIKNSTNAKFESQETKQQVIERLGFNKDQANRFETMASNKDIVEQVKAEARENEDIPTRTRVLQLVKEKTKEEKDNEYLQEQFSKESKELDKAHRIYCRINDAVYKPISVEVTEENVGYWVEDMSLQEMEEEEKNIDEAIFNLNEIKRIMKNYKVIRRVK